MTMHKKYRAGGYVKLAKLWERAEDEAREYQRKYYEDKFADDEDIELVDVYIDITGSKSIAERPEMLRLISDCISGRINCIASQTRAYLAANTEHFCYLIKYLFDLNKRIDIITEDLSYNIDTIANDENQREALYKMAIDIIGLKPEKYDRWEQSIIEGMSNLHRE